MKEESFLKLFLWLYILNFIYYILRWEFRTEDFDIGFGVSRKVKKGEEEVLVPLQRVNSQLVTEEGCLVCTEPGTCKFSCHTFSDSDSIVKMFEVQVLRTVGKLQYMSFL